MFVDRSNVNGQGDNYARAGVRFLYLKASEGLTFRDPDYGANVVKARAARVPVVGAYHFARPDLKTDPVAEAERFLSIIGKPAPGQFRPALDLERTTGSVEADVAWAEAFVKHVRGALGYWPVLYGSTSFIAGLRAHSAVLRSCPWWRAEYGPNSGRLYSLVGGTQGAVAHQYTSVGNVSGLAGDVDMNVFCAPNTPMLVPHPRAVPRISKAAWERAQWSLGIGKYKGRGRAAHVGSMAPGEKLNLPKVPKGFTRAVAWYRKHLK